MRVLNQFVKTALTLVFTFMFMPIYYLVQDACHPKRTIVRLSKFNPINFIKRYVLFALLFGFALAASAYTFALVAIIVPVSVSAVTRGMEESFADLQAYTFRNSSK